MTEVFEFSGQPPVRRIYNFNKKSSTKKKKKKKKSSTRMADNGHFGLEFCLFYVDENYI